MAEITRAEVGAPPSEAEGGEGQQQEQQFQQPPIQPPREEEQSAEVVEPQTPPVDEEYVYPDDPNIPEQLRGRKASEAARLFNDVFATARNAMQLLTTQQAPQQQQQPHTPPEPIFGDDDFVTGRASDIEQKLGQLFERRAQPFLVEVYTNMSMLNMQNARQILPHYAKYEHEIMAELGRQPVNMTANFSVWKDAHDRVVARHVDEISQERARNKPPVPVTERGGGAERQSNVVELSADDKRIAEGLGVSPEVFLRYKTAYDANSRGA